MQSQCVHSCPTNKLLKRESTFSKTSKTGGGGLGRNKNPLCHLVCSHNKQHR